MSPQDKIKNAKETSWPLVTPKKETITYLDGFADGLNMANNSTNKMLDKIRAEIEQRSYGIANDSVIQGMKHERAAILKILDKYKVETEAEDGQNTIKD